LPTSTAWEPFSAAAPIDQEARFIDLVGCTTLRELASVLVKARLLLSNDTMAPHLAAALGLDKIFVVSRGDLYGRCLPYPPEISRRVRAICHPEITRDPQAFRVAANSYGYVNRLDIDRVTPEMVIEQIDKALRGRENAAARECRVA
jgi:ADP-heptose:LPS heptosyltransferase